MKSVVTETVSYEADVDILCTLPSHFIILY